MKKPQVNPHTQNFLVSMIMSNVFVITVELLAVTFQHVLSVMSVEGKGQ